MCTEMPWCPVGALSWRLQHHQPFTSIPNLTKEMMFVTMVSHVVLLELEPSSPPVESRKLNAHLQAPATTGIPPRVENSESLHLQHHSFKFCACFHILWTVSSFFRSYTGLWDPSLRWAWPMWPGLWLCPQWKRMEGGLEATGPEVAARQCQFHKLCQDLPGRQSDSGWKDPLQKSHNLKRFPLHLQLL